MPNTVLTRRRLLAGGVGLTSGSAVMLAGGGRASAHGTVRLSADDVLAINNLKAGCAYGSDALAGGRTRQGWRLSSSAATTLNVETVPPG